MHPDRITTQALPFRLAGCNNPLFTAIQGAVETFPSCIFCEAGGQIAMDNIVDVSINLSCIPLVSSSARWRHSTFQICNLRDFLSSQSDWRVIQVDLDNKSKAVHHLLFIQQVVFCIRSFLQSL